MIQKRGLLKKIMVSYLVVITSLLLVSILIFVTNLSLLDTYSRMANTMVVERQFPQKTRNFVESYNSFIQNNGDEQRLAVMYERRSEIEEMFRFLSTRITSEEAGVAFLGLNNTIKHVFKTCFDGVDEVRAGNYENAYGYYDKAILSTAFVLENTTTLIDAEVGYLAEINRTLERSRFLAFVLGIIMVIMVGIGSIIYSLIISRNLTRTLEELTEEARKVSEGDLDVFMRQEILVREDEIGSLARSFEKMIGKLRDNMKRMDELMKSLVAAKQRTETEMASLSKINELMSGREKRLMNEIEREVKQENSTES